MAIKIQLRRGTAAEWTSANPTLMQGEMGVETDTLKVKIGNGTSAWTSLPYFTQGVKGDTGPQGPQGIQGVQGNTGPTGPVGPANTLSVGTVTTGAAGSDAVVTIAGTSPNQTISFTIPQGIQGIQGVKGDQGVGVPSGGSTGQVVVKTVSGTAWADPTLDFLSDVVITSPSNGQALTYDSATSSWKNATPANNLSQLGDVTVASPADKQVLQYEASSGKWKNKVASGGVTVSEPAPTSPIDGDGWFYATDGTLFVRYNDGNSTQWVEPSAPLSSQIEQRYFSPNYLINGAFDVWQRGTSLSQSGGGVGVDMWREYTDSGSGTQTRDTTTYPAGLPTQSYKFTATANSTNMSLWQIMESAHCAQLIGQTVTFSVYLMASSTRTFRLNVGTNTATDAAWSSGTWVTSAFQDVTVGTSWSRYSITVAIPTTARTLQFSISSNGANMANGTSVNVASAQVELGSTPSPFRRNANSVQGELSACQRYYQANDLSWPVVLNSTSIRTIVLQWLVPMRTSPTLAVNTKGGGTTVITNGITATGWWGYSTTTAGELYVSGYTVSAEL